MSASTDTAPAEGHAETIATWLRLFVGVVIGTIGSVGLWSGVVALPAIQTEFGVERAGASLPYTLTMLGFAFGGVAIGRLVDRFGIGMPLALGATLLGLGYILEASAASLWQIALIQGLLIGAGSAATFAPLMAEVSHWFTRRRGIAVAIAASGNYLAGAIWPPVVQHFIASVGWRQSHLDIGLFCLATMLPLILLLVRGAPKRGAPASSFATGHVQSSIGLSPGTLQGFLCLAGLACCVAMAMPQVHLVAYCGDLGYGPARGAEMLSLMLGFGIVSRVGSGFIADRIGAFSTLLLGSALQASALLLYLAFDSLVSLYVVSALFGLFQGGIVPCYAIIIREFFPAREAGTRIGMVIMATLFGMALGGWMSGALYDLTGSYQAAFLNGFAWNLVNLSVILWLMLRRGGRLAVA